MSTPSTMNCKHQSNYCMIMIKLIGIFDKLIPAERAGLLSQDLFQNIVTDSIVSLDLNRISCPFCGRAAYWDYHHSQYQKFSWNVNQAPIYVCLPMLSFQCTTCNISGNEMITTDITIDKTGLSFHYLFQLMQIKNDPLANILYKESVLYERLREHSLERWIRRFNRDCKVLHNISPEVGEEDVLSELICFRDIFLKFYDHTGRFFISDVPVRVFIDPDV